MAGGLLLEKAEGVEEIGRGEAVMVERGAGEGEAMEEEEEMVDGGTGGKWEEDNCSAWLTIV